jgi:hypothetical protein
MSVWTVWCASRARVGIGLEHYGMWQVAGSFQVKALYWFVNILCTELWTFFVLNCEHSLYWFVNILCTDLWTFFVLICEHSLYWLVNILLQIDGYRVVSAPQLHLCSRLHSICNIIHLKCSFGVTAAALQRLIAAEIADCRAETACAVISVIRYCFGEETNQVKTWVWDRVNNWE